MGYREELTELMEKWTDGIDITDNWNEWENFLTNQGIIKTYDEVYEMDLDHLRSCGHDYGNAYITDSGKWDVESLIENDEDITLMSNGCYFVHNQQYIDDYIIDLFYEQLETHIKIKNSYRTLKNSKNAFKKLKAILTLLKNDFGEEKIYFASSMNKVRRESVKLISDTLKTRNRFGEDYGYYKTVIFDGINTEDDKYIEILKHIGYQEFCYDAQEILESDFVILKEHEGNQDACYFTYENIKDFGNYIDDVLYCIENECINIDDPSFTEEINEELNKAIDNYWDNTFEFNYSSFEENQ